MVAPGKWQHSLILALLGAYLVKLAGGQFHHKALI